MLPGEGSFSGDLGGARRGVTGVLPQTRIDVATACRPALGLSQECFGGALPGGGDCLVGIVFVSEFLALPRRTLDRLQLDVRAGEQALNGGIPRLFLFGAPVGLLPWHCGAGSLQQLRCLFEARGTVLLQSERAERFLTPFLGGLCLLPALMFFGFLVAAEHAGELVQNSHDFRLLT